MPERFVTRLGIEPGEHFRGGLSRRFDRRRKPRALVLAYFLFAPRVMAKVRCDTHEPWPPRFVHIDRRPLDGAHESLLNEVLRVGSVSRQAIAVPPEKSPCLP